METVLLPLLALRRLLRDAQIAFPAASCGELQSERRRPSFRCVSPSTFRSGRSDSRTAPRRGGPTAGVPASAWPADRWGRRARTPAIAGTVGGAGPSARGALSRYPKDGDWGARTAWRDSKKEPEACQAGDQAVRTGRRPKEIVIEVNESTPQVTHRRTAGGPDFIPAMRSPTHPVIDPPGSRDIQ